VLAMPDYRSQAEWLLAQESSLAVQSGHDLESERLAGLPRRDGSVLWIQTSSTRWSA